MSSRVTSFWFFLIVLSSMGCASAGRDRTSEPHQVHKDPPSASFSLTPANKPDSGLYFLSFNNGWALVNGVLYRTADGGATWQVANRRSLSKCKSVIFASEMTGWALCDLWDTPRRSNTVLATLDGGKSWQQVLEVPTPVYSVHFVKDDVGFVSSRWFPLHRTSNGGKTWTRVNGIEGLHYLFFIGEKKGWGYGGAIWYTEDAGNTWKQVTKYEDTEDLWNADFPDASSGWIVGRNQVWHLNGSETWSQVKSLQPGLDFLSVSFLNPEEGWISASDGSLFHTTDGGSKWELVSKLANAIVTIRFLNNNDGWALDTNGNLIHSGDGGRSWTKPELD